MTRLLSCLFVLHLLMLQLSPAWCPMQRDHTAQHQPAPHHGSEAPAPAEEPDQPAADCDMALICGASFLRARAEIVLISTATEATSHLLRPALHSDAESAASTPPPRV